MEITVGKLLEVGGQLQREIQEGLKLIETCDDLIKAYNTKIESIKKLCGQVVDLCNGINLLASKN